MGFEGPPKPKDSGDKGRLKGSLVEKPDTNEEPRSRLTGSLIQPESRLKGSLVDGKQETTEPSVEQHESIQIGSRFKNRDSGDVWEVVGFTESGENTLINFTNIDKSAMTLTLSVSHMEAKLVEDDPPWSRVDEET